MTTLLFKPVTIGDQEAITSFTLPGDFQNCDYAFANMCSWQFHYGSEYAVDDGFLFIRFQVEDKGRRRLAYMFPVGNGDRKAAIERMEADAAARGFPLLILGVTPELKSVINDLFPNQFTYITERDYFDYIYLRRDLALLNGKKYQPKRNHINRFKNRYEYTYLPISPDIVPQCMEVERIWCRANLHDDDRDDLALEHRSMTFAMNHFGELGLSGGAIVVDGKIIAFTYGSPVNRYTFAIHAEKADVRYEGIFSLINREFAVQIPEQYVYINREEDLGLPGLRRSKSSYHPAVLLEKNAALKRR
jgi:hypothetical protein